MDVRFGLYVVERSPVKVEKRARRRCLFKTRFFAKLLLFAKAVARSGRASRTSILPSSYAAVRRGGDHVAECLGKD